MQFIVIGLDGGDVDAPNRRQLARQAHLERYWEGRDLGVVHYAAALLDEYDQMIGSVLSVELPSRDAVDIWLNDEPYVTGEVWKTIDIHPCKLAPSSEESSVETFPQSPSVVQYPEIFPALETERLLLRELTEEDQRVIFELASSREIAATTEYIPHPYEPQMARAFVRQQPVAFKKQEGIVWGIVTRDKSTLVGVIGLRFALSHERANFGYWVGVPYWGKGYATEALDRVSEYAFIEMKLRRVEACVFDNNSGSIRVLEKCGFEREGTFRKHFVKWGEALDVHHYARLM